MHSRSEQNATFLLNRQNEFKKAAMSAKASGNIELAKKYLRMAKVSFVVYYSLHRTHDVVLRPWSRLRDQQMQPWSWS